MLITQQARQNPGSALWKRHTHTHKHKHHYNTHFASLFTAQLHRNSSSLISLSQQEGRGGRGGGRGGGSEHCSLVSQSSWRPHTPPSPELSHCCHGDLIPFHLGSSWWSGLSAVPFSRGWDSGSHVGTRFRGREGAACWECCGSNTGALPGNSSMPVQQITVVPARETASNSKSAPRSKDKNEVSFWPLNPVFILWSVGDGSVGFFFSSFLVVKVKNSFKLAILQRSKIPKKLFVLWESRRFWLVLER